MVRRTETGIFGYIIDTHITDEDCNTPCSRQPNATGLSCDTITMHRAEHWLFRGVQ